MKVLKHTLLVILMSVNMNAVAAMTEDEQSACEMLFCLADANPPHECDGPLSDYFSIKKLKNRVKTLLTCPAENVAELVQEFRQ